MRSLPTHLVCALGWGHWTHSGTGASCGRKEHTEACEGLSTAQFSVKTEARNAGTEGKQNGLKNTMVRENRPSFHAFGCSHFYAFRTSTPRPLWPVVDHSRPVSLRLPWKLEMLAVRVHRDPSREGPSARTSSQAPVATEQDASKCTMQRSEAAFSGVVRLAKAH